mmetsp:Transcript_6100/g.25570  ORF Transcript_6100/g.25570 Transcript_6100/m.25570 type:complete len:216 (-) Transcript_6100:949-1596(-)
MPRAYNVPRTSALLSGWTSRNSSISETASEALPVSAHARSIASYAALGAARTEGCASSELVGEPSVVEVVLFIKCGGGPTPPVAAPQRASVRDSSKSRFASSNLRALAHADTACAYVVACGRKPRARISWTHAEARSQRAPRSHAATTAPYAAPSGSTPPTVTTTTSSSSSASPAAVLGVRRDDVSCGGSRISSNNARAAGHVASRFAHADIANA